MQLRFLEELLPLLILSSELEQRQMLLLLVVWELLLRQKDKRDQQDQQGLMVCKELQGLRVLKVILAQLDQSVLQDPTDP